MSFIKEVSFYPGFYTLKTDILKFIKIRSAHCFRTIKLTLLVYSWNKSIPKTSETRDFFYLNRIPILMLLQNLPVYGPISNKENKFYFKNKYFSSIGSDSGTLFDRFRWLKVQLRIKWQWKRKILLNWINVMIGNNKKKVNIVKVTWAFYYKCEM